MKSMARRTWVLLHGQFWRTAEDVAEQLDIAPRTARRALAQLVRDGYAQREWQWGERGEHGFYSYIAKDKWRKRAMTDKKPKRKKVPDARVEQKGEVLDITGAGDWAPSEETVAKFGGVVDLRITSHVVLRFKSKKAAEKAALAMFNSGRDALGAEPGIEQSVIYELPCFTRVARG